MRVHRSARSRRTSRTRLVRTAQLAAEMVTAPTPDRRTHADLERQLGYLSGLHGVALSAVVLADVPPLWTIIVDGLQGAPNHYELDLKALRSRVSVTNVDLTVSFRDRPGQELTGRLETAPIADTVIIDPDDPPSWLR